MKYVYMVFATRNILLGVCSTEDKANRLAKTHNDKFMEHSIPELRSVAQVRKEKVL